MKRCSEGLYTGHVPTNIAPGSTDQVTTGSTPLLLLGRCSIRRLIATYSFLRGKVMRRLFVLLIGFAVLPLACGGRQKSPGTAGETNVSAAGVKDVDWAKMDHRARLEHMKAVVLPTMLGVFREFDPEHYAEFDCTTCHGPGARRGEFAMPSAALPKLPAHGDFAGLRAQKPEVFDFMVQQVVPAMARAMGESPYDPATGQGFGCSRCHQTDDG